MPAAERAGTLPAVPLADEVTRLRLTAGVSKASAARAREAVLKRDMLLLQTRAEDAALETQERVRSLQVATIAAAVASGLSPEDAQHMVPMTDAAGDVTSLVDRRTLPAQPAS